MKKTTSVKSKTAKRSLKEPVRETAGLKKFKVTLVVAGDMLDKDTPISAAALQAFFEMQSASSKGVQVNFIEATEIVAESPVS
jgi:hypothetical protein